MTQPSIIIWKIEAISDCLNVNVYNLQLVWKIEAISDCLNVGVYNLQQQVIKAHICSIILQILDPLRAMIMGAPLEDARHLAQRYSRMRQEAETQVQKVDFSMHT